FDLFTQADRSLARSEGGLGIGLTLVRSLAELHGGTITAASDGPDKGSEFILRLPADVTAAVPESSAPEGPEKVPSRRLRILVVDDNVDADKGMAMLLRFSRHTAQVAHNGPDALALAREHGPEVVILDIGLPGMDGYEVATRLRREDCCKEAVIIAVSGYGQDQDRRRSQGAGFRYHLVQPIDHRAVLALPAAAPPDLQPPPRAGRAPSP